MASGTSALDRIAKRADRPGELFEIDVSICNTYYKWRLVFQETTHVMSIFFSYPAGLREWWQYDEKRKFMTKLMAVCCIALFAGGVAQTSAQEKPALRLVQTIPLPGVTGRLDHMGVDPDHYDLISKIKTRPGSGTSLLVPQSNRFYVASQAIGDQDATILVYEPVP